VRNTFGLGILLLACHASARPELSPLPQRHWLETVTTHFNIYSCGSNQQVAKVGARLEQFREAYSLLAGAQALASAPIVVIAFPDHESMEPFLRLYQGKPANQAAFFLRGSDENFIALYLSGQGADSLEAVFHEFTHLLLRHNSLFWPMWLNEGMAEIYATFETTPDGGVRIGKPHGIYLRLLADRPWMSLPALFAVGHDSPDYNERDRQGMFYAESWLLTHYLMLGDNQVMKSRFGRLTVLLKQGQTPEQAFTNAMGVSTAQMEKQLRGYFERGRFQPLTFAVKGNLTAPQAMTTRAMAPVEVFFRLGDMLMRVERPEEAAKYFGQAAKLAPKSPLPYEGLGLLAAQSNQPSEALRQMKEALQLGSTSFLAHYVYAAERYRLTCKTPDMFTQVDEQTAAEIRSELQKSLGLMPNFAPAHRLLGFFLMVQGENMAEAEQHLQRAIQLEPENSSYQVTLAQIQTRKGNVDAARHTLEPLRLSYVAPEIRKRAEEMLQELGSAAKSAK
jgi:tetratricopeptide (TPR) repeat protein